MEPSHQRNVASRRGGRDNSSTSKENHLLGPPLVATEAYYPNVNQVAEFYPDVQYPQQYYYSYLYPYYGLDYLGSPVYYPVQQPWQNPEPPFYAPRGPPIGPGRHVQHSKPKQRWNSNTGTPTMSITEGIDPHVEGGGEKEVTEMTRKKKKRRNKKKTTATEPINDVVIESDPSPQQKEREELATTKSLSSKKVHFQVPEKEEKPRDLTSKEATTVKVPSVPKPLDYSKLFASKSEKVTSVEQWPVLTQSSSSSQMKTSQRTQTFADKLKDRPFLDWRDQRTVGPEPKRAENTMTVEVVRESKKEEPKEDGWTQVGAKKKSLASTDPVKEPSKDDPSEANKLKKEKRKQKEKEKKRRLREQKALEEKLAPKGRKVTILTPQMLQKLQSSSKHGPKTSQGIALAAEDYPPLLAAPRRISESDSEWETTEVEVAPAPKPLPDIKDPTLETKTAKAIRRKDPIQLDLFSLIKVNKPKKEKAVHGSKVVRKHLVTSTNKLDSSAPNQYRGKIRNRKKKTTPLRRAIAQARQQRREQRLAATEVPSPVPAQQGPRLHTRKFREYCDQMLTDEIDALAKEMLSNLRRFQDRAYQKDPVKGRMRKRLVAGLREVTKQVDRNRIKLIFLAPDIERCPTTGGLDQAVNKLLDIARTRNVPCVYALSRRKLGRILSKHVAVSCCATFNYQGTEEIHRKLIEAVDRGRQEYAQKTAQLQGAQDRGYSPPEEEGNPAERSPADQIQENLIAILKTNLNLNQ